MNESDLTPGPPPAADVPTARFATAAAFSASVNDRLRLAASASRHSLTDLRRQFAYQRLLARVFADPSSRWVLKGATSLLVRFPDARHSLDIDLYRADDSPDAAVAELRRLGAADLDDFFRFAVGPPSQVVIGIAGVRVPVAASIGTRQFADFKVDVVTAALVTGTPEVLQPESLVDLPGLRPPPYRLYPLADHIADKVCAIVERHGPDRYPSTRYRDLVDLVLIAQRTRPRAAELAVALRSELARRALDPITTMQVPDKGWSSGYAAEARRAGVSGELATLDGALALVRSLIDPVLAESVDAVWSPATASWGPSS